VGLELQNIAPLPCTSQFLNVLSAASGNLLAALGALGVGNERMLIPEYTAVKDCFAATWPEAKYSGFLDANIHEDVAHTEIIERVASRLITSDADAQCFYKGAITGVDARMTYYDELQRYADIPKA